MIEAMHPTVAGRLEELEAAIAARRDPPDEARADLAGRIAARRGSVEREREADGEERHQLGHDLRAHLDTIAGWTHILRMDGVPPPPSAGPPRSSTAASGPSPS